MTYQRYEDADLKAVEQEVSLEARYGGYHWQIPALIVGGIALVLSLVTLWWRTLSARRERPQQRFQLPERLTPFSVIGFLRQLEAEAGFDAATRQKLAEAVSSIEHHFFESPTASPPDIERLANSWLKSALANS